MWTALVTDEHRGLRVRFCWPGPEEGSSRPSELTANWLPHGNIASEVAYGFVMVTSMSVSAHSLSLSKTTSRTWPVNGASQVWVIVDSVVHSKF